MFELNDFSKETECIYKGVCYSVRDNGAVLRNPRDNARPRQIDSKWTFGRLNEKTGYLEIASVRIHRIVATAFHGVPPTKEHVIDHKDTNKQNNRPGNLRWVTRLENVLLNPITVKRIEIACGCSVEEFLEDPSKFRNKFREPNYEWMCTVGVKEAQASKERLLAWAESDKSLADGSLGAWIYSRSLPKKDISELHKLPFSLTMNAQQKNWRIPAEFPCCPKDNSNNSIAHYATKLKVGNIFSRNQYAKSIIEDFTVSKDGSMLWVICRRSDDKAIKPYSLAEVTFENNFYVHKSLGSFFKKDGAEKQFTLAQGLEWTGGETFDELCS